MAENEGFPPPLARRVGFLLAQAHNRARENADAAIGKLGLSARAYGALATVVSDGPVSQQALSRRLHVDPATMVDVMDWLERSGYVVRNRNPHDRREYALEATVRGKALFARAHRALGVAERAMLRAISAEERQALMDLLTRIAG